MNARLERKLRFLAIIMVAGTVAGLVLNLAQGRTSYSSMFVGITYGLLMCVAIGCTELFILDGPMQGWLGRLSFTKNLMVRSAIYAVIIVAVQSSQSGEVIAGLPRETSGQDFWHGFILSAGIAVLMNLGFSIARRFEGKGLMREALIAATNFMFEREGLHRIMANFRPENIRSERLLTSIGFRREGFARSYLQINGRWADHVLTSMINPADLDGL